MHASLFPLRLALRSAACLASLAAALCASCATVFPLPMTASALAAYDSGPALVAYLGQPDASPAVCDLRARTPHPAAFDDEIRGALVDGFIDGKIAPAIWQRCIDALAKSLAPADATSLFDRLMQSYAQLLTDSDLSTDPSLADRLNTLHRLYLDRTAKVDARAEVLAPIAEELRSKLAKKKLGALAAQFAQELLATLELEKGNWQGRAVDLPQMDALAAVGNEMTLTRFSRRLPTAAMRNEARHRLLRIHIALSPFDEVRAAACDGLRRCR